MKADGSIWIGTMKEFELMSNHHRHAWDSVLHRESLKEIHWVGKTVERCISTAVFGCMNRYKSCLEVSRGIRNPSWWWFNTQNVEATGSIQCSPVWQTALSKSQMKCMATIQMFSNACGLAGHNFVTLTCGSNRVFWRQKTKTEEALGVSNSSTFEFTRSPHWSTLNTYCAPTELGFSRGYTSCPQQLVQSSNKCR